jgi:hypothetical protein
MQAATALCTEEQTAAQGATASEEQGDRQAATAVCPEEQVETTVTAVCPEEQGEVQTTELHPLNAVTAVGSQKDRTVNVNVEQS